MSLCTEYANQTWEDILFLLTVIVWLFSVYIFLSLSTSSSVVISLHLYPSLCLSVYQSVCLSLLYIYVCVYMCCVTIAYVCIHVMYTHTHLYMCLNHVYNIYAYVCMYLLSICSFSLSVVYQSSSLSVLFELFYYSLPSLVVTIIINYYLFTKCSHNTYTFLWNVNILRQQMILLKYYCTSKGEKGNKNVMPDIFV